MWKHFVANVLTIAIVLLIVAGGLIAWGKGQYSAQGPLENAMCLRVESGSTMRRVSQDLETEGAISNGSIFRVGAEYTGKTSQLKAGSFLVPPGASMEEIIATITEGGRSTCGTEIVYRIGVADERVEVRELDPESNRFETIAEFDPTPAEGEEPAAEDVLATYEEKRGEADTRYRVALAEGVTSWQVIEAMKAADFLQSDVEEIPPEGTLAPDSYEVTDGTGVSDIIARMTAAQQERLDAAWQNRAPGVPLESPEEALILASIVEKETGLAEERPQVASVFVNRLKQGMRLQTDPTVIYGVTEGRGVLGRGIRQSELDRETPWNTYVIDGLPVTPIANPGQASIEAALNPDETEYLFFVADGTGGHAFSTTLAEHNENVARWREIEAERAEGADTAN